MKITPVLLRERWIKEKQEGHRWAALTATDYPSGRILDGTGLDFILVGDSLGMVALGYADTTEVTLETMVHHTAAVARGVQQTFLVADLPKGSYETKEIALKSAAALQAAGASAVKLEGGRECSAILHALTSHGIPVLAHIGLLPQRVREEGAYRKRGKTVEEAEHIRADAMAVQKAGAFGVVLEMAVSSLAAEITHQLQIPVIGIGSGECCDGKILVLADVAGISPWYRPKFATCYGDVAGEIQRSAEKFIQEARRMDVRKPNGPDFF